MFVENLCFSSVNSLEEGKKNILNDIKELLKEKRKELEFFENLSL